MSAAEKFRREGTETADIDLVGLSTQAADAGSIDAPRLARELYGIEGSAKPLHGERNANFLIEGPRGRLILKIAGKLEDLGGIGLQIAALEHLERADPGLPVPHILRAKDGRATVEVGGQTVYAVSVVPGRAMTTVEYSAAQMAQAGVLAARVDRALR